MYVNLENAIEILGTTGSQIKIVIPIQIQLFFIIYFILVCVHTQVLLILYTHTGTRFTGTCHVCMYVCVYVMYVDCMSCTTVPVTCCNCPVTKKRFIS